MSLSNRQVGEYLETQSADYVLDLITGEITESMLEHFFAMCAEHGKEYQISARLFAGAIIDKVAEQVNRDEEALAMFGKIEYEELDEEEERLDRIDRARDCNAA